MWTGAVLAGLGVLLVVAGWSHQTQLEAVSGGPVWERELLQAFAHGGLRYAAADSSVPPSDGDATAIAKALDEQERRQQAEGTGRRSKVRVDTSAKTPCPT